MNYKSNQAITNDKNVQNKMPSKFLRQLKDMKKTDLNL